MSTGAAPTEVVVLSFVDGRIVVDARAVVAIVRTTDDEGDGVALAAALGLRDGEGPPYAVHVRTERGTRTLKLTGRAEIVSVVPAGYMPLPARFADVAHGVYTALVRLDRKDDSLGLALDVSRLDALWAPERRES